MSKTTRVGFAYLYHHGTKNFDRNIMDLDGDAIASGDEIANPAVGSVSSGYMGKVRNRTRVGFVYVYHHGTNGLLGESE